MPVSAVDRQNAVDVALNKLSTCKTLRLYFYEMVDKYNSNRIILSLEETVYFKSWYINKKYTDKKKQKLTVTTISQKS